MPVTVFLSYRRDDTKHAAGRLAERLDQRFELFMDVDDIGPGRDFTTVLRDAVDHADVVLALIGPAWLTVTDPTGARRIDDPDDWVVQEVATALARRTPVIPVLVDGARMPSAADLPAALADLARLQAVTLTHETFAADAARLVSAVEAVAAGPPPPTSASALPAASTASSGSPDPGFPVVPRQALWLGQASLLPGWGLFVYALVDTSRADGYADQSLWLTAFGVLLAAPFAAYFGSRLRRASWRATWNVTGIVAVAVGVCLGASQLLYEQITQQAVGFVVLVAAATVLTAYTLMMVRRHHLG
jgi:hypothetical protein